MMGLLPFAPPAITGLRGLWSRLRGTDKPEPTLRVAVLDVPYDLWFDKDARTLHVANRDGVPSVALALDTVSVAALCDLRAGLEPGALVAPGSGGFGPDRRLHLEDVLKGLLINTPIGSLLRLRVAALDARRAAS